MTLRQCIVFITCVALLSPFVKGIPVQAEILFNPHYIISDEDMTDVNSLSLNEIQSFLEQKRSGLATMTLPDYHGVPRKASEIIYRAAQESQISPKALLVTLQKEQSLVTFPFPTQTQLDRAMGYRCPDGALCHPNALGFGKQVDGAAWQFREYFKRPTDWTFQVGKTYSIDGYSIVPINQATAGLYNYTPHHSGNQRFWQLWQNYWGLEYPDGSLVKAQGDPGVWFIQYDTRRLISSWSVLLSRFDPKKLLPITKSDLEKYEIGPPIKFHNYSLLQLPDGAVYLLVNDELRHIVSEEVFRTIGFNWDEVEQASERDVAGYQYGEDITLAGIHPTGALLQNRETGAVYFVENGKKFPIQARELMTVNFPGRVLTPVSEEQLEKYQTANPITFRDGELVRAHDDSKVYVISNGYRRWIASETSFAKLGYTWNNIIVTSQAVLNLHPLGADIQ